MPNAVAVRVAPAVESLSAQPVAVPFATVYETAPVSEPPEVESDGTDVKADPEYEAEVVVADTIRAACADFPTLILKEPIPETFA